MSCRRTRILAAHLTSSADEMGDRGDRMLRASERKQGGSDMSTRSGGNQTLWSELDDVAPSGSMSGKTVFLSGASRGIGKAIALRMASDGANVIITGKTAEEHPTLPGTIFTAAAECEAAGGKALAVVMDVRDEDSIQAAVAKAVETFGGIDACICVASAIFPQPLESFNTKRFDLMLSINTRGTTLTMKACMPHLKKSGEQGRNPHVLVLSPPIDFSGKGLTGVNTNYMIAKCGMTLAAMYATKEYNAEKYGIGFNTLWPVGLITTSALNHMFRNDPKKLDAMMRNGRVPAIQADAAYALLTSDAKKCTGNQTIDEDVLRKAGKQDFSEYEYMTLGATMEERLSGILNL